MYALGEVSTLPRFGDDEGVDHAASLDFVEDALRAPVGPEASYVSVTIPAPQEAPEKFLRLVDRDMGFLWRSPSGIQFAGGGAAVVLSATGADRFANVREQVDALWPRVEFHAMPEVDHGIVLFGGAAFVPDVPQFDPWEEFGDAVFSVPKWGYRRLRDGSANLTLTVPIDELRDPNAVSRLVDETRSLLRHLEHESATSLIQHHQILPSAVHHVPPDDWNAYIASIKAAIGSRAFDKIVAARRCVVDLNHPLEDTGFMARLFAAYPDCIHFAVRREHATFLGATPETLFCKRGRELMTHALAGTTRVNDNPNEDSTTDVTALTKSSKDLVEHALVVKRICETLWPFSKRLRHSSSPHARRVRNLLHLQTPISAELRPEVRALDLVGAMHPTPAVGGTPAREAAIWLRENEPQERGWYTGTLGWIAPNDDAEFGVAIRCGVLTKKRAHIFAGAGIVEASSAEAEYRETGAKMYPILRALGVSI